MFAGHQLLRIQHKPYHRLLLVYAYTLPVSILLDYYLQWLQSIGHLFLFLWILFCICCRFVWIQVFCLLNMKWTTPQSYLDCKLRKILFCFEIPAHIARLVFLKVRDQIKLLLRGRPSLNLSFYLHDVLYFLRDFFLLIVFSVLFLHSSKLSPFVAYYKIHLSPTNRLELALASKDGPELLTLKVCDWVQVAACKSKVLLVLLKWSSHP